MLVVDAANVVGSRPNGWWRDRAGAAAALVADIRAATAASVFQQPVVVVLEGAARGGVAEGTSARVTVVHAAGEGDDTLATVAAEAPETVTLVSADRALGARCRALGCSVVGPKWLLEKLSTSLPSGP